MLPELHVFVFITFFLAECNGSMIQVGDECLDMRLSSDGYFCELDRDDCANKSLEANAGSNSGGRFHLTGIHTD